MNNLFKRLKEPSSQIAITLLAVFVMKEVPIETLEQYKETLTYLITSVGLISATFTPEGGKSEKV